MSAARAHVSVDLVADEGLVAPIDAQAVERIVGRVLLEEGVTRPCAVSVSVVGDERMRKLNAAWRGIDAPTDVLSLECERPDDPDLAEGEPCELGDIVLASAYVTRQAQRLGVTAEAEFTLLLVHGLLHLLGYDHLSDDEAEIMEAREDELVAGLLDRAPAHVVTTRHGGDSP